MLEILEFVFSSLPRYFGTCLLLLIIGASLSGMFHRD